MKKINVLVVGAGMYVCGRGTQAVGTILPVLMSEHNNELVDKIVVATHSIHGQITLKEKSVEINHLMGTNKSLNTYIDLDEAITNTPEPRCAIISTPDDTHSEIALKLMDKGFHLLVVKPLAPTLSEVKRIIASQEKNQVYGMVEFHKRFDRANLKLKEAVLEKRIGDPLYFIVEYSQRKSIPTEVFKAWVNRTNIMQYLGIHYIDIIYFATKATPIKAMAVGQKGFLEGKGYETFDSILATIEWQTPDQKRFHTQINTNWIDPENTSSMSDQRIKVIGTKGRLESDQKYRGLMSVSDERNIEEMNPDFCQFYLKDNLKKEIKGYGVDSINTFLTDVGNIVNQKKKWNEFENSRPTFKDSIIPTQIIEAINKSLEQSFSWIDIE